LIIKPWLADRHGFRCGCRDRLASVEVPEEKGCKSVRQAIGRARKAVATTTTATQNKMGMRRYVRDVRAVGGEDYVVGWEESVVGCLEDGLDCTARM
jgi:hypothetical protein